MTLRGPKGVRDGESFELTGTLLQRNGRAVPDAEVQVADEEPLTLLTDAECRFTWEAIAELDPSSSEDSSESELLIELHFPGSDHLGPSSASLEVAVGLPRIVVETMEPVARGDTVVLRGTVLVGSSLLADVPVSIGQDDSISSNEIGAFTYDYHVSRDLPLGTSEVLVSAEEIGASVSVPIEIRSTPSLTFDQAEESVPGMMTMLSATLLDDKGTAIPQATLRSSQGLEALTNDMGVALVEVTVPDTEEPALVPLTLTFDGDSRNMPLSASFVLAIQPPPSGFNWLLWVGFPSLLAAIGAATLARGRLRAIPVSGVVHRLRIRAGSVPDSIAVPVGHEVAEDDEVEAATPTELEIFFVKAAQDLPDVWGAGELVSATFMLTDHEGQPIAEAAVSVSIAGTDTGSLQVTDEQGACAFSWTCKRAG